MGIYDGRDEPPDYSEWEPRCSTCRQEPCECCLGCGAGPDVACEPDCGITDEQEPGVCIRCGLALCDCDPELVPTAHLEGKRAEMVLIGIFFQKVGEAVKAGYYVIPNMPMDVFAVRRSGIAPSVERTNVRSADAWGNHPDLPSIDPKLLPAGEGDYRNPRLAEQYRSGEYEEKGAKKKFYQTESAGFRDEIDFPFVLAKPDVLNATQRALALKIIRRGWRHARTHGAAIRSDGDRPHSKPTLPA